MIVTAHAFRLVTEPGDEILTFAPFFPEYHPYVDLTGAVLKVVPPNLENFQINFEAFEEMLTEKVKAVLINTPNNPSGVVYSTPTLQRLADILREKSREYGHIIYLISDEPYREIVFEGVDSPCVSYFYDNTIMCYSFSKSLSLPGERIGYVAVNPACEDAETMINMCGQISRGIGHNCPPSIIQLAVAQVLDKTADLSVPYVQKCEEQPQHHVEKDHGVRIVGDEHHDAEQAEDKRHGMAHQPELLI